MNNKHLRGLNWKQLISVVVTCLCFMYVIISLFPEPRGSANLGPLLDAVNGTGKGWQTYYHLHLGAWVSGSMR